MGNCCGSTKGTTVRAKGKGHALNGGAQHNDNISPEERRRMMAEAAEQRQNKGNNKGISQDGQINRDFKENQRRNQQPGDDRYAVNRNDYN